METKAKIVVIGSCSVDFTTYATKLPQPGETIHGFKFTTSYGGKGANQCVAAAKLGANTFMICRLGEDQWAHKYKEHLMENGVNVDYVNITAGATTGIAQINVAASGENQIVIVPGANSLLSAADVEGAKELIVSADILIAQLETPIETTLEAFKLNRGIKLLNAAPANPDIEKILKHCTILCVNESEASLLTNLTVDNVRSAIPALNKLLQSGCEIVIITLGGNGALYSTRSEGQAIHVKCDPVHPVDTTGAGDAFVGALAKFLISHKGHALHQIVGAACHIATISVTMEGTQTSYPTKTCDAFSKEYDYVKVG